MRIKIFSDFCDSVTCKYHYERVCDVKNMNDYGQNKKIYITTEDDYTHAIILNTAMPVLKNIEKKNVLGLAFEPVQFLNLTNEFIQYAQKYIGKYFIGDTYIPSIGDNYILLPYMFKAFYSYMWHITPFPSNYMPPKTRLMSIMVSEKQFAPGHIYRHTLVKHILNRGLPIDIYGRGANKYKGLYGSIYKKEQRLKGQFKELEPYFNYHFHICIENFITAAYFSEKITNTLLSGTTPIYWGCSGILNYFPENVILLSGDVEKDITLLQDILSNPIKYKININIPIIKSKLNLLNNIENIYAC